MKNLDGLFEDPQDNVADDKVIADRRPADWQRLAQKFSHVINELREGRMCLSLENDHRGLIGPQHDGCIRVDIEVLLVRATAPYPSFLRRR